ncbi:MAG: Gfo/Idh/MocA family oxidoreductase [Chloroflexi bacterium]|nr:Gfo/Idh/MocA family oxidoreductase [Chloroflexota bacterium]MDA1297550.1 Gfo/Idh/MocA family oxidoreductase [Chloroflexota bacterium]
MAFNIALVGCGGMGLRHAHGYVELIKTFGASGAPGAGPLEMIAVCDRHEGPAKKVADLIEQGTGKRPAIFLDFDTMLRDLKSLDAVDIVTDTPMHHRFAMAAMDAGLHAMTEKPMGLTLKACRMMRETAMRAGKVIAVAENYRRDPVNRLSRALLDGGAIGRPYFALDVALSSARGGVMHGTVWRAKRDQAGGTVLDAGVHNADMLLYLMGPARTVYAETATFERQRELRGMESQSPQLAEFYSHRVETGGSAGDMIEHDAADTAFAVVRFESGAIGQLSLSDTSHGERVGQSSVHGSDGTLIRTQSRSGKPAEIRREGESIKGADLLALVPEFRLDDVTAGLWGSDRVGSYDFEFRETDRKIVAIEYADFARAVATGTQPEVGPQEGMAALALAYGVMESGEAGVPVSVDDVVSGAVSKFQDDIDRTMGI